MVSVDATTLLLMTDFQCLSQKWIVRFRILSPFLALLVLAAKCFAVKASMIVGTILFRSKKVLESKRLVIAVIYP